MDDELMRKFAAWRRRDLLTEAEFAQVSQQLLGNSASVPEWISKLRNACALAESGQISLSDFKAIKARIFGTNRARINLEKNADSPGDLNVASAESLSILRICTGIACVIGLFPLPFAHAPLLIILQYIMLLKICEKFGRRPGWSLILIILAAVLGPLVFGIILRFIPFARSIFGAVVAGAFTWYIGAKIRALCMGGLEFTFHNFINCRIKFN